MLSINSTSTVNTSLKNKYTEQIDNQYQQETKGVEPPFCVNNTRGNIGRAPFHRGGKGCK